jgi:hypothetical protein
LSGLSMSSQITTVVCAASIVRLYIFL